MLSTQLVGQLKNLAQEVSQREGCRLYDIEFFGRGRGRTLRVFIDTPDHDVTIDQCANVSRGLSLLLDVEDLIPGETYQLEVSSPGLDRPLKELWHFEEAVGQNISVKTDAPIPIPEALQGKFKNARQQIKGQLTEVKGNELTIHCDGQDWTMPYEIVKQSKIIYEFEENEHKKDKKAKNKKR